MSWHMKKTKEIRKKPQSQQEANSLREVLGIKGIQNGVLHVNDDYLTFLEVMPVNFKLKSEREQNYIIGKYEELFKTIKVPFVFFTIAKKADAKRHIDYIQNLYEAEENKNVRAMMDEYMDYVKEISYGTAVRRRFIVAIPFTPPPGMHRSSLSLYDIESWLHQKSNQFKEAVGKCGNEVADTDDKDRFVAEILYELLNVKSSEWQRMVKL